MCGICGIYNHDSLAPVPEEKLRAMTNAMVHRGPDDEGFYFSDGVGLGFRRLSIIDLAGGHQPMSDPEEKSWVVFNGEIYNFQALRKELEGYGHVFRTRSDTEVIVQGYRRWGRDVLNKLNGMFGLAIWDDEKKELLVARDPMGIKIVYYSLDNNQLTFASEIRALLAIDTRRRAPNPEAIGLFLEYRYTPAPYTIFSGIRKLAAGECLIASSKGVRTERWWKNHPVPLSPAPSVAEAEERLTEIFMDAIRRQLISDVPLGLFLSGGMDSAMLLALMKAVGSDHRTYTVGYGRSYHLDELEDAADTARTLGAVNEPILLDQQVFEDTLAKVVRILEEPVASSSVVPMYHVCQRARQDVTVALVGQGPDELFGGYLRHLGVRHGHYWRSLPGWARSLIRSATSLLPRNETIKRSMYSLDVPDRLDRYQAVFSIAEGQRIDDLFHDGVLKRPPREILLEGWNDSIGLMSDLDELGGFQFLELRSSLPDELLLYADKISMAHSLEIRVPYLDLEVVRYVESLPSAYKVHGLRRKWIQKRVCHRMIPRHITRRKKRGFGVSVVDDWFRNSLQGRMMDTFRDPQSRIFEYLAPGQVNTLLTEHQQGVNDNHKILFSLVVLEEWLNAFASA